IRQAFSLSEDTSRESTALLAVLNSVKDKFRQLREEQEALHKQLITTADTLQVMGYERLKEVAGEINREIQEEVKGRTARARSATRRDKEAGYHTIQIVQAAKALNYFANREIYQAWALLSLQGKLRTEILFSLHGVGKSTGMLVCTAMA